LPDRAVSDWPEERRVSIFADLRPAGALEKKFASVS
jgi:hypothetical protein